MKAIGRLLALSPKILIQLWTGKPFYFFLYICRCTYRFIALRDSQEYDQGQQPSFRSGTNGKGPQIHRPRGRPMNIYSYQQNLSVVVRIFLGCGHGWAPLMVVSGIRHRRVLGQSWAPGIPTGQWGFSHSTLCEKKAHSFLLGKQLWLSCHASLPQAIFPVRGPRQGTECLSACAAS